MDYAFTDNIFGRVEYRYNDYGSKDLLGVDTDFNQNVVTVGVGFKFWRSLNLPTNGQEMTKPGQRPGLRSFDMTVTAVKGGPFAF